MRRRRRRLRADRSDAWDLGDRVSLPNSPAHGIVTPMRSVLLRRGLGHRGYGALECGECWADAAAGGAKTGQRVVVAGAFDDEALYWCVARRPRQRAPQRPGLTRFAMRHRVRTGGEQPVVLRRAAH